VPDFSDQFLAAIGWVRIAAFVAGMAGVAWSGLRPGAGFSSKWYDRIIRGVGGIILFAFLTAGLIMSIYDKTHR
jgi:hypothetical protein